MSQLDIWNNPLLAMNLRLEVAVAEIEKLRQQLTECERERDEARRTVRMCHEEGTKQLATVTKELDELVETLKYFSEYGYGRDICIAALAKLGAGGKGE